MLAAYLVDEELVCKFPEHAEASQALYVWMNRPNQKILRCA